MRLAFLAFFWLFFGYTSFADPATITLDTANHISLIGTVNQGSVDKVIKEIFANKNNNIYLYINSPGGSVIAGLRLIDAMKSSGKTITCAADMAMSMAFAILQACTHRVVSPSGLLMQHVSSLSVSGPTPNTIALLELAKALDRRMSRLQSARLRLSVEEFNKKVRDDWWIIGDEAVDHNVADSLALITCSPKLINSSITLEDGTKVSACPIISSSTLMNNLKLESLDALAKVVKSINAFIFSDQ